jgi:hypothetical protein
MADPRAPDSDELDEYERNDELEQSHEQWRLETVENLLV